MKKYIVLSAIALLFVVAIQSCKKLDEEPPRNEGTLIRKFIVPKAQPLSADQSIILRQIRDEYNSAIN